MGILEVFPNFRASVVLPWEHSGRFAPVQPSECGVLWKQKAVCVVLSVCTCFGGWMVTLYEKDGNSSVGKTLSWKHSSPGKTAVSGMEMVLLPLWASSGARAQMTLSISGDGLAGSRSWVGDLLLSQPCFNTALCSPDVARRLCNPTTLS